MIAFILLFTSFFYVIALLVSIRILTRRHRDPTSRLAWLFVLFSLPAIGVILYFFLGETSIGKKYEKRSKKIRKILDDIPVPKPIEPSKIPETYKNTFSLASSVNNFPVTGGNTSHLTRDNADALNTLIADIDNATSSVHLCFYIWLDDDGGMRVLDAVKRAYNRGVQVRILVDAIGSKKMIRRKEWKEMIQLGVQANIIFGITHKFTGLLPGRVDIRNHRKIAIIDNTISYVGSLNCCDSSFYTKPKFAPWIDIFLKVQGNVVLENQKLFISDWYVTTGEDISQMLYDAPDLGDGGFPAVVVGTGPTEDPGVTTHLFLSILLQAEKRAMITTPYFVPTSTLISSICSIAKSGVDVTIMFPDKNDSFVVGAASKSYYEQMLRAGVKIYHFKKGILHAKIATIDEELCFLGSTNLDRRSFELNYENNMLLADKKTTSEVIARQEEYLKECRPVTLEEVESWSLPQKILNNAVATMGPVL